MDLYLERTMQDTADMAHALLNSCEILEESEWYDHFSEVLNSFCEFYNLGWPTNVTDILEVKKLRALIRSVAFLSEGDLHVLRMTETILDIVNLRKGNG
jgi:hypothetical protein